MNYPELLSEIPLSLNTDLKELSQSVTTKLNTEDKLIIANSFFFLGLKTVNENITSLLSSEYYKDDKFFLAKKEFIDVDCTFELVKNGLASLNDANIDHKLYLAALTKVTEDSVSLVQAALTRTKQKLTNEDKKLQNEITNYENFLVAICNEVITLISKVDSRYKPIEDNLNL